MLCYKYKICLLPIGHLNRYATSPESDDPVLNRKGITMPNRMKELRKARKINQSQLAALIGVSTSAIGMYEQGRRDPDTGTLLNIARALDVSLDYLVGECNSPERFDVNSIAKSVAQNLMNQPALMFNAECYTDEELSELSQLIENSVRDALIDKLQKDE